MSARPDGAESAYERVARDLRNLVLQRADSDERLPTEAELAKQHSVSRQTVRRAFQDLVAEGMVYRVPGRGTFASRRDGRYLRQFGSIEDLMGLSLDTELEIVQPLQQRIDVNVAARLRLQSDTVATLSFRRLHQHVPFCRTTVHLPPHIGSLLDEVDELREAGSRSRATLIGLIDKRLENTITEADQSISAGVASAEEAQVLEVEPGHPVLRVDRTYYNTKDAPVELAVSQFLPEHYSYRVRLRRSMR